MSKYCVSILRDTSTIFNYWITVKLKENGQLVGSYNTLTLTGAKLKAKLIVRKYEKLINNKPVEYEL